MYFLGSRIRKITDKKAENYDGQLYSESSAPQQHCPTHSPHMANGLINVENGSVS